VVFECFDGIHDACFLFSGLSGPAFDRTPNGMNMSCVKANGRNMRIP
jgi:hypothetical protein